MAWHHRHSNNPMRAGCIHSATQPKCIIFKHFKLLLSDFCDVILPSEHSESSLRQYILHDCRFGKRVWLRWFLMRWVPSSLLCSKQTIRFADGYLKTTWFLITNKHTASFTMYKTSTILVSHTNTSHVTIWMYCT